MPPTRVLPLLSVLLALEAPVLSAAPRLEWKLRAGQHLNLTMDITMRNLLDAKELTQTTTTYTTWIVQKIGPDGTADIVQKTARLRLHIQMTGRPGILYDSNEVSELVGQHTAINNICKTILKSELKFQMTSLGKVQNVQLPENLTKSLKDLPGTATGRMNEEALKKMAECFPTLPEEGLEVGKGWSQSTKVPFMTGTLHQNTFYTYHGIDNKDGRTIHRLALKNSLGVQENTFHLKLLSLDSSGDAYFDEDLGYFTSIVQKHKLLFEMPPSNVPPQQMPLEMTVTVTFGERKATENEPQKGADGGRAETAGR